MRFKKWLGLGISFVIVMSAAFAIFAVNAQDAEEEPTLLFIGTVTDNEDEFVAVALDGENVILYICDGNADEDTVSIAQWFVGTIEEDVLSITAPNGNSVTADVTEDSITGKFTFADGTTKDFVVALASGEAAFYRTEFDIGEEHYVGGWIVLPDGSVRGAINANIASVLTPAPIMVIAVSHEIVSPRR